MDPSNGGLSLSPLPGDVSVRSGQQMAYATRSGMFVSPLEFQVGSCLYVTAAVRGGRPRACRTWSQRPKFVQGSLEPVAGLVPPPSPSLPFLSLLFGVFLNGRLRIAPPSLFLSLFPLHLPSSLGVPGCFVIAGNPSPLLLSCVLGRMRRSWEHLPFFSPFSRLSLPLPPVGTLAWVATRGSWPSYYRC